MDGVFPSRFFDRLRTVREPEKRLMAAVLDDAAQVYFDHVAARTKRDREALRKVETWLASDDASSELSFRRICDELAVDPAWFRQVLARWRSYRHALRRGTSRPGRANPLAS